MLFKSAEGEVIVTESDDLYFSKALELIKRWESKLDKFEFKTSGSTGTPKTLEFKRQQIIDSANLTQKAFNLNSDDLLICSLDVEQTGGKMMLYRSMVYQSELIVLKPSKNPLKDLFQHETLMRSKRGKVFFSFVPYQLQAILKERESVFLDYSKVILLGGSGLSPIQEETFKSFQRPIFAGYGMTETLGHVALRNINLGEKYYRPLEGVEIKKSKNGFAEIKSKVTENKWVKSKDYIEFHGEKFEILGRSDKTIISAGIKIDLNELEKYIEVNFKPENRFFLSSVPDEQLGERLVLFVESEDEKLKEQYEDFFEKNVQKYQRPKQIIFCSSFIETESQKINYKKTIDAYLPN